MGNEASSWDSYERRPVINNSNEKWRELKPPQVGTIVNLEDVRKNPDSPKPRWNAKRHLPCWNLCKKAARSCG